MPVYNIRYVYVVPGTGGTPGEPYECNIAVRANTATEACMACGIKEVGGVSQITGIFFAVPTTLS